MLLFRLYRFVWLSTDNISRALKNANFFQDNFARKGMNIKKESPLGVSDDPFVIRVGFEPTTPSLKGMCSTS